MSIRASKQTMHRGLGVSLEQALAEQFDYPAVKALATSEDYIEGAESLRRKAPAAVEGALIIRLCHSGRAIRADPESLPILTWISTIDSGFARFTRAPE